MSGAEVLFDPTSSDAQVTIGGIGSGKSAFMELAAEIYRANKSLIFDLLGATDGEGLWWAVAGHDICNYKCTQCKKQCPYGLKKHVKTKHVDYHKFSVDPEPSFNCHPMIMVYPEYWDVQMPSHTLYDHVIPYQVPNEITEQDLIDLICVARQEDAVITIADNLFDKTPEPHFLTILSFILWNLGKINQEVFRTDITLLAREIGTIVFSRLRVFPAHEQDLKRSFFFATRFMRHMGIRFLWDLQRANDLDISIRLLARRLYIKKQSKFLLGDQLLTYWRGVEFRRRVWFREHGPSKLNHFYPSIGRMAKHQTYPITEEGVVLPAQYTGMPSFHHRKPHDDFTEWTGIKFERTGYFVKKDKKKEKAATRIKEQRDKLLQFVVLDKGVKPSHIVKHLKACNLGMDHTTVRNILKEAE